MVMKKIVLLICLGVSLNSFSQKSIGDLNFKKIQPEKPASIVKVVTAIVNFPSPDSVVKTHKMVTMYFTELNVKTTVTYEFYLDYLNTAIVYAEQKLKYSQSGNYCPAVQSNDRW